MAAIVRPPLPIMRKPYTPEKPKGARPSAVSTSYIERQNLIMRMQMRRFTHLTNGYSKKLDNLKAAVGLHFAHYNYVRVHQSLRITPAMASGLTDHVWTLEELLLSI